MKSHNWFFLFLIFLLVACSADEGPICSVNTVTIFERAFTRFTFTRNPAGAATLDLIKVYDGTDSSYTYSYTYSSGALTTITRAEDGVTTSYTVTIDGSKVTKLNSKTPAGKNQDEIRFVYNNEQVTQSQSWLANAAGTLFQVGHQVYTYDSKGDLTKVETYIDLLALFSLVFGLDPSAYSPIVIASAIYEPSNSANPLKGHYYLDNLELSFMQNIPKKITYKDLNGATISSDTYTIEQDGSGLPSKATSGSKYVEATYTCQ